MTYSTNLGILNGHAVGIIMKEMVRRAVMTIRNHRQAFEVHSKIGYSGTMNDVLTSADGAAQKVYVRTIREAFPDCGLIAEEDSLVVPPSAGCELYFTVDPLCGTKAFVRRQSHGIGTMISLCDGEDFLAAHVGDINTLEIYGFRPGSDKVHRIDEFTNNEDLVIKPQPLKKQYVALRDPEVAYASVLTRKLINSAFKNQVVDGGSIGIWLARLWKGEVGAALIPPGVETPWDSNPVCAISQKLGFVFLRPNPDNSGWSVCPIGPIVEKTHRDHDMVIVHKDNAPEILEVKL